jgi:hypothetical protein
MRFSRKDALFGQVSELCHIRICGETSFGVPVDLNLAGRVIESTCSGQFNLVRVVLAYGGWNWSISFLRVFLSSPVAGQWRSIPILRRIASNFGMTVSNLRKRGEISNSQYTIEFASGHVPSYTSQVAIVPSLRHRGQFETQLSRVCSESHKLGGRT